MSGEREEPTVRVNPAEARHMPGTELAAARNTVHDMAFDEMLIELMAMRDMSVGEVARKIPCTAGHIANLTNAAEEPTRYIATRLDEVLKAGGRLLELAESRGRDRTRVPAASQDDTTDLPRSLSLSLPYVPGRLVIEISGATRNENLGEDDRALGKGSFA